MATSSVVGSWTFLTNHGHVLLALFRNPDLRQRDIAEMVGITEGAVHRILNELQDCGYITAERIGRRNHYRVDASLGLRHPLESAHSVGDLLDRLASTRPDHQPDHRAEKESAEQAA